ncbi:MAG: DUF1707 domain-containing protein [Gemmatimonadaceae bacterium]|nr:DUF1707 domain-containing protein [Gemmatimonadaceae bacterium]
MPTTPVDYPLAPMLSSADRDHAVALLSDAYARDAISMRELDLRMEAVYRATDHAELARLTEDLPGTGLPGRTAVSGLVGGTRQSVSATFSTVEGLNITVMPTLFDIRALFGNVELDFRETVFQPGVTEISIHATLGNIEIKLPPHVEVEQAGELTFCSFSMKDKGFKRAQMPLPGPGASIVRFTGQSFMTNIEIRRIKG